jgi:hypothetical protein
VDPAEINHTEQSVVEKAAIQNQLARLLVSPYFSHSRRIPSLLRYVIDQTLSGQPDMLKERTLGIELFGRDADYDTASDSIVRVTAAEVRKRIAQYYLEPDHENELRISLPSGSYIPQFHWPQTSRHSEEVQPAVEHPDSPTVQQESLLKQRSRFFSRFPWGSVIVSLTIILVGAGAVFLPRVLQPSKPVDPFWEPILKTNEPILFCVADQNQDSFLTLRDANDLNHQIHFKSSLTAVSIDDLGPILRIGSILQSKGKKYTVKAERASSLMDLRNGSTIFIGAFDNAWTLRLTRSLRYHFANNPEMSEFGIIEGNSSFPMRWAIHRPEQIATNNYRDFAIVARFTDTTTGKLAVVAAGVGQGGTIAAGEFLSDPENLLQAMRNLGTRKNMEFVISTQIIDGEPGTAKVETAYFW